MVNHSDTHRWPSWVTPGQTDPNSLDNLHPIPEFVEKMISFDCMNIIMIDIVIEPVTNICCHGCDAKFAPRLTQTSSRSLAWSPRHKSQVRFVTELQSTNTGPGADCWHPPPSGPCSDRGWGLPVFVTKINKWSAQTRQTDRTVEEWIKHSSSGWQPGGYLIFVVIYSHSSLSGWLYLPDPESPVRSQAGNTFLRLLLTEICLTSILDTFKNRINQLNYGNAEALFSASLQQFTGKT